MESMWTPCFEDLLQFDEVEFVKLEDFNLESSLLLKFVNKKEGKIEDKSDGRISLSLSDQNVDDILIKEAKAQTNAKTSPSQNSPSSKTFPTKGKTSMCYLCGKLYSNNRCLTSHMYLHTRQNPYSCKLCPMTFRYHSRLKAHMKTHSPYKDTGKGTDR